MRLASMVLPAPGGPIMRMLCPPAQATSRARLALSWPFTSAKSGRPSDCCLSNSLRSTVTGANSDAPPFSRWRTWGREWAG